MKTYEEIRKIYISRYPHLIWCKDERNFAENALRLAAPYSISPRDTWNLAKVATEYKEA